MTRKKSQSATEYLIILAIVLLVVVGVISLVGDFSSFRSGNSDDANKLDLLSRKIAVTSFSVSTESIKLQIENTNNFAIELENITIDGTVCDSQKLPLVMGPSNSRSITCSNIYGIQSGELYTFDMSFDWQNLQTTTSFTQSNMVLQGRVGTQLVNYCSVNADCPVNDTCIYGTCYSDVIGYYNFDTRIENHWIPGKIGGALELSDSHAYATLREDSIGFENDLSLSLWVKANIFNDGNDEGVLTRIIASGDNTYYGLYFERFGDVDEHRLYFSASPDGLDTEEEQIQSDEKLQINKWYHIVATIDNGFMQMYVDGVLQSDNDTMSGNVTDSGYPDFNLGAMHLSSGFMLNGSFDDVAVYNRSLTSEEVLEIYDRGAIGLANNIASSRSLYFPLDNNRGVSIPNNGLVSGDGIIDFHSGGSILDSSYLNNAAIEGEGDPGDSPKIMTDTLSGNSYYNYTSQDDYISLPDIYESMGNGTLMGWMKISSYDGHREYGQILLGFSNVSKYSGFNLGVWGNSGYEPGSLWWKAKLDNSGTECEHFIIDPYEGGPIPLNEWFQIALTIEEGTGSVIYLNGQEINSNSCDYFFNDYNDDGATLTENYIGFFDIAGGSSYDISTNGSIDDVLIFNKSLSASEILALYNNAPHSN